MTHEKAVTTRLPSRVLRDIEFFARADSTDRSEQIRRLIETGLRQRKIDYALRRYRDRSASIPWIAEFLGVTVWEVMEILAERGVEAQYSAKDFDRDLKKLGF